MFTRTLAFVGSRRRNVSLVKHGSRQPGGRRTHILNRGGSEGAAVHSRHHPPVRLIAQAQDVGDTQRGAQVFAQCKVSHSHKAGKNMLGPSLHGLIGRKAGSVPGYAYSPAGLLRRITSGINGLGKVS